jgi:catechol 2,3-dioxygenase-like lactoylglutathione lyase family enzyme
MQIFVWSVRAFGRGPVRPTVHMLNATSCFAHIGRITEMLAKSLIPILNVSDMEQTFAWFEKLGWKKSWDWGSPPDFGCVCSGEFEIFLSLDSQGSRNKRDLASPVGSLAADKGFWICIMVENVDEVHGQCLEHGLEITLPPTDQQWGIREIHVRHPDGHVLRIGHGIDDEN